MKLEFEPNVESLPLVENTDHIDIVSQNNSPEVDLMLRDGIKAAQNGERAEARQLLLQVTEADSKNENAWLWLASISEYPEELLVFLNNVLKINPENQRAIEWIRATKSLIAKTFVKRGITAVKEDKKDFARQCFLQAIVNDDKSEPAWLWLASVTDSPAEKISHLQKVLDINPENENALSAMEKSKSHLSRNRLSKAKQTALEGNRGEAQRLIENILQISPDFEDAWLLKSHLADSFSDKIVSLEKVLQINPDNEAAKVGLESLKSVFNEIPKPATDFAEEDYPAAEEFQNDTEQPEAESFNEDAEDFVEINSVQESFTETEFQTEENENDVYEIEQFSVEQPDADFDVQEFQAVEEAETVEYEEFTEQAENFYNEQEVSAEVQTESIDEEPETADDTYQTAESEEYETEDGFEISAANEESPQNLTSCQFCSEAIESQSFICKGCNAILTLSDIEMVLGHEKANKPIVSAALETLEAKSETESLDPDEMKTLGIGYLNLKDMRKGFSYLQKAAQSRPEDIVLVSQVDALAIRISEIEQQGDDNSGEQKSARILVIDDSPTVRKLISSKLEKCGHEVTCAVDGMDALAKLNESVPDLILLDIMMPRMDGYQVCKLIRSNAATKDIPIVMISGNDGFFDKVRGKMAGTTNYITKPFGPETLMKTVNEYIS